MNLRRFLGRYYVYLFLFDAMLCYAVYTALFELRGLSFSQIGALLAFWSLSAIVLELAYLLVVPAMVLSEARFQRLMEGRSRATTTSALSVAQNVTGILVTFGFGLLAEWVGILPAYGWAGLVMLPVAFWVWLAQRRGMRALD